MKNTASGRAAGDEALLRALRRDVPLRLKRLRGEMAQRRLDAFLVVREPNVHYLSGFRGTDTVLLVGSRREILITDFRFEEEAALSAPGFPVAIRAGALADEIARQLVKRRMARVGFESDGMFVSDREDLAKALRHRKATRVKMVPCRGLVEGLRVVKSDAEVACIRRSIRIAESAAKTARTLLAPGKTERDVARGVLHRMEAEGAEGASFDTIAAFDANSALPHARPGLRRASGRSVLLLDWGARAYSYCSDLTRVYAQHSIPTWLRKAHAKVYEAQRAAIARVGPGVRARDVDAAARDVLKKAGWGRLFGHGVGHGVGLEVHEPPRLGPRSMDVLRPGMVVTIEPGVYFGGRGGVRIEDDVLVTATGVEVLSRLPRTLD
jgi:Xaa-Pro aminopeptidase